MHLQEPYPNITICETLEPISNGATAATTAMLTAFVLAMAAVAQLFM